MDEKLFFGNYLDVYSNKGYYHYSKSENIYYYDFWVVFATTRSNKSIEISVNKMKNK